MFKLLEKRDQELSSSHLKDHKDHTDDKAIKISAKPSSMKVVFKYKIIDYKGVKKDGFEGGEPTEDTGEDTDGPPKKKAKKNEPYVIPTKEKQDAELREAAEGVVSELLAWSPRLFESNLKKSDISFRIENGEEMCHQSCRPHVFGGICSRGCMWKRSLILEIAVPSMDTEKNRAIACLIKTFLEDWHSVNGLKIDFSKGILRVVSDDHDDNAISETDASYMDQLLFANMSTTAKNGKRWLVKFGYVKFGNHTLFDRIDSPLTLGGNGGPDYKIEEDLAEAVEKDGFKGDEMVKEIKRIRETEAMKDADLREVVRSDIVNHMIMLDEDIFKFCAHLWSDPFGWAGPEINDELLNREGGLRSIIIVKIKTTCSQVCDKAKPGYYSWLKNMEDPEREILTTADLIKKGFFDTFIKDWGCLSPDMVTFHFDKTEGLTIVIDVPHLTDRTKEVMVISALLAAFIYEYHGLKWNAIRLNSAGYFSLSAVETWPGVAWPCRDLPEDTTTLNQILTNLKRLEKNPLKFVRDMVNVGR